jgi:spore germination protein KC
MKSRCRYILLVVVLAANTMLLSGCWNYREIDKLAIVAGVAIDREQETNRFLMTTEIIDLKSSGKEVEIKSQKIDTEGETIFDAVRNMIKISAKRLYWSHLKVIIISQDIAKEGVVQVIDLFIRDSETRLETYILISKESTAKELLSQQSVTSEIRAFEMNDMLKSQKSLAKAPVIEAYKLINTLGSEGVSAVLPAIGIEKSAEKKTSELSGTAVFKEDKLAGFLESNETKYFLFILDEIKGGLLIAEENLEDKQFPVALEILNSKTKIKPFYSNGRISMKIDIRTEAILGERGVKEEDVKGEGREGLILNAEKSLEENIKKVIEKVKKDFGADIFGFGKTLKTEMPTLWKSVAKDWNMVFKNMDVDVKANIEIKNSGFILKPIKVSD